MKSNEILHIGVADTSTIVRLGVINLLKRSSSFPMQVIEIATEDALQHCFEVDNIDILIINPQFGGWFALDQFRQTYRCEDVKFIALLSTMISSHALQGYDESIDLFDDLASIDKKLNVLLEVQEEEEEGQDSLSQREREIISCVVKGMTNKEIAESLYISVHTVITHRRNIARKLQIHSAAGLTIYAIANKLVELSDVKIN